MTKDLNSNISLVEYNSLNLPSVITFSNNMDNITNIYTSTGTKLRSISSKYAYLWEDPLVDLYAPTDNQAAEPMLSVDEHPDFVVVDNDEAVAYVQEEDNALAEAADDSNDEAVISEEVVNAPSRCKRFWGNIGLEESKTTDYCANVIYQDGKRMLLVNGGYVTFNDSLSYGEGLGGACYHYYLKDHLGNIREVVNDMGQINQVTNYYPFGSPYCDTQSTINPELQPFKYNGKELDMMHGLNAYDYGARQYYSPLPVWDRIDPLAEKYYNVSPYVYCMNNPIKFIDPDGRKVWVFATKLPGNPKMESPTHTFVVVKTSNGKIQRFEYGPKGDSLFDTIFGNSTLTQCSYKESEISVDIYMSTGRMDANTKNVEAVNVPDGMTSDEFDDAVIKSAAEFKGNTEIKYRVIPLEETEGNCNTSTTSLLKNAGVSKTELNRIGKNIKGIKIGFGSTKAWNLKQRKEVVRKKDKNKAELNESLSNHIGF